MEERDREKQMIWEKWVTQEKVAWSQLWGWSLVSLIKQYMELMAVIGPRVGM